MRDRLAFLKVLVLSTQHEVLEWVTCGKIRMSDFMRRVGNQLPVAQGEIRTVILIQDEFCALQRCTRQKRTCFRQYIRAIFSDLVPVSLVASVKFAVECCRCFSAVNRINAGVAQRDRKVGFPWTFVEGKGVPHLLAPEGEGREELLQLLSSDARPDRRGDIEQQAVDALR